MKRIDVYNVLDEERAYQDEASRNPNRPDMVDSMNLAAIILAMESLLEEARRSWYKDSSPYDNTMHYIRKVTALGIKAGETYGMPARLGSKL